MRIGILTSGGDCPGLNAAIRGAAMRAFDFGWEVLVIQEGWKGLVKGQAVPLTLETVDPIIGKGGTVLGTSRLDPYADPNDKEKLTIQFRRLGLQGLIALGGEGSLSVASQLADEGYPVVGVPKTMDNDLSGTDYTFGFDTAVQLAVEAAHRLQDTAESHRRVFVLEVMGRHAGWVALHTALASGADWAFIPEQPLEMNLCCQHLRIAHARKNYALVVASEGVDVKTLLDPQQRQQTPLDSSGHLILSANRVAETLAHAIEGCTGFETRYAVIGHMQRGGAPTAFDRLLAMRLGFKAAELARDGQWGMMSAMRGRQVVGVPLHEAVGTLKTVPPHVWQEALTFFK